MILDKRDQYRTVFANDAIYKDEAAPGPVTKTP